ncbi:M56 family metallopeptidase [Granulicella arctica]|uniref:TonB family protein n=1 Tax=Granulicella arctica TaxID=940613 RepID=A0A7Y9PES9_9BACT|nr:M56 family metallopeptidase [Granulicella arctica]NYF78578.1 TonB family protein [Granulicella arctica]
MNGLESWVLGYLVNALWQAPLVFAAAWVAARLVRRGGARMEHRVWVSALVLEAVLPACSLRVGELLRKAWALVGSHGAGGGGSVRVDVVGGAASGVSVLRLPAAVLAGIAVAYVGCVLYFAARMGWGLWKTGVMRRRAERVMLVGDAAVRWERLERVMGVSSATMAVSAMTAGPVTVGVRRGVMLVPLGFLEGVAEGDWDAVVAHEFAHMRRWDFVKNAVYGVVSLPVVFHPAMWLTRARVAATREMVCDAMAAEAVAGRERYARSLLRLASLLVEGTPVRTLHAIGIFDANMFERRVMNLTEKRVEMHGARRLVMAAACVGLGVVTCGSAMALRMEVAAPVPMTAAAPAGGASAKKVPGEVMAGQNISKKTPEYPEEGKKDGISGAVVLDAVIGKDGTVQNLRVKKSLRSDFDTSAINAVREWTYKPYLLNGNPTEVETTITVHYSLAN